MKKSLLALAVMGAFAGAAQAQVTVYGLVDVGIISTDLDNGAGASERLTELGSGVGAATRWGIRGQEDLGNGLKAHFVLESGFNADSGSGSGGFSRLSYVGLEGGFGTVRLGRQDTAMKVAVTKIDPFGAAGMANAHDFLLGANHNDEYGIDQRRPNQLTYLFPKMGGFNGGVYYNFGEVRGDNSADQIYGLNLGYDNGPIKVQLAYENVDIESTLAGGEQEDVVLGATYDFGAATLHALYGTRSSDYLGDWRSGMLGISAPLGSGKVMANYMRVDNRDAENADSNVIAVGYNYSLSKRTAIIARYVHVSNDDDADLGLFADSFATTGENASGFGIGIQHRF